jgi:prepilin-type processing-associated H-X9-DG protein
MAHPRLAEAGYAVTAFDLPGHGRSPPAAEPDPDDPAGRWATMNCFAQAAAFINTETSDIRGPHPGGAEAAFADGRVTFLNEHMDPVVLAALCTRNGGESAAASSAVP